MARLFVPVAALIVSACGGDSGTDPKSGLSTAQQTKIAAILQKPEVLSAIMGESGEGAMAASMMPFVAMNMRSLGTLNVGSGASVTLLPGTSYNVVPRTAVGPAQGSYKAFGGQYLFSVKDGNNPEMKMSWTGIIAFNDLDNPTDIITAGVTDLTSNIAPTSFGTLSFGNSEGNRRAYGSFIKVNGNTATGYSAISGSIGITSTTFSGAKSCGNLSQAPMIKVCSVSQGTVKGVFNFTAKEVGGSATVTVGETNLDVPAARLNFEVDFSNFNR